MNRKVQIKSVFPGGNTYKGFYSFYDYILPQDEAARIFVIKGGPGVGKSTFMKKIGTEMVGRGYKVEYMHCSSDNDSLDGVVIPDIKVALVDGTAPHMVDPKNPGCIDEIINLGEHWNEEGIRINRDNIVNANKEVGKFFARAYRYLAAAKHIYDDYEYTVAEAVDKTKVYELTGSISKEIFAYDSKPNKVGKDRHLFASAITPDGLKNYLPTVINQKNVYILKGLPGTGVEKILSRISEMATEKGLNTECYHCAYNPEKLEHVVIPELDTALTTANDYHSLHIENPVKVVDLNIYIKEDIYNKYEKIIEYDRTQFDGLLSSAVEKVAKAKAIHDHMEKYYVPNMDFVEIQKVWEKTLERILDYEE